MGTLALEAMRQAVSPRGIEWSRRDKEEMVRNRAESTRRLTQELAAHSIAVRRTDTFPGLDGSALRLAVRPPSDVEQLIDAVQHIQSSRRA